MSGSELYPTSVAGASPAGLADLARQLAAQGGLSLVYAPSTTTVTSVQLGEGTVPSPLPTLTRPVDQVPVLTRPESNRSFTLGQVIGYSGVTLMGGATLSGLVSSLLTVPELVPVLAGILVVLGMLAALAGAVLDGRERDGAGR